MLLQTDNNLTMKGKGAHWLEPEPEPEGIQDTTLEKED